MFYEEYRDTSEHNIMFFKKDLTFPAHFHKSLEIIVCNESGLKVDIENKEYTLKKGEVCFIHSNLIHCIRDNGINTCLFIPIKFLNLYFSETRSKIPETMILSSDKSKEIYSLVMDYDKSTAGCNFMTIQGYVYYILGKISELLSFTNLTETNNDYIARKLISYLFEHYKENVTLEKVASDLAYNKYYISEIMNNTIKTSFNNYLNRIRLEHFNYVYDPAKSIESQIFECGFSNRQTFYRVYKKMFGSSPKKNY